MSAFQPPFTFPVVMLIRWSSIKNQCQGGCLKEHVSALLSLQWVSINPKLIFTGDKPSGFHEIQHVVSTRFLYNTLHGTKTVCTTGSGGSSPRAESMKEVCFSIGGLFHIGKRRKRWDSLRKLTL